MFRVKNNDQSHKNKNEMIGQNICKDAICKFITAYENHFLLDEAKKTVLLMMASYYSFTLIRKHKSFQQKEIIRLKII